VYFPVHAQVQKTCQQITVEQLKNELQDILQFVFLYPPQGDKGPYRTATIQSKLNLNQSLLAGAIGLDSLISVQKKVGKDKARTLIPSETKCLGFFLSSSK
jgi:hypothetical protein